MLGLPETRTFVTGRCGGGAVHLVGRGDAYRTKGAEGRDCRAPRDSYDEGREERRSLPLVQVLGDALDEEDDSVPCAVCAL